MEQDEARKFLEEGTRLFREGKFSEALESCDKALAIDPKYALAWHNRGSALGKLGRYQEALESCDKALAIDPKLALAWVGRGAALSNLGRNQEALESCDKALGIDPKDAFAWNNRGVALDNLGRHQEALESYDKALALDPKLALAWHNRGIVLGDLGRYQEALESCDKALAIDPKDASAWAMRGIALGELGRLQEAVESYEKTLAHKPEFSPAWELKVAALERLEEWLDKHRPPEPYMKLYRVVAPTEKRLHLFIQQRLQGALGKEEAEWWVKGVPTHIRQECAKRREEDPKREPAYNQIYLIDLKEILDKNWSLFEVDFQRVKGQVKSKKGFLDSLTRLNEIRRPVMHPVRDAPPEEDQEFARQMWKVIQDFTASG